MTSLSKIVLRATIGFKFFSGKASRTHDTERFFFIYLGTPNACPSPTLYWLKRTSTTTRRVFHGKGFMPVSCSALLSLPVPRAHLKITKPWLTFQVTLLIIVFPSQFFIPALQLSRRVTRFRLTQTMSSTNNRIQVQNVYIIQGVTSPFQFRAHYNVAISDKAYQCHVHCECRACL